MGKSASINVHHVTRVEGHGNIVVDLVDGELTRCDLEIVEAPRFFEALLRGRPAEEAPRITCRICGICSVGHATASIQAVEDALGIRPGPRTRKLRRLNMCGEWFQSHVLHVAFLVAPDAFGAPSVIPLARSHPEVVRLALRLKGLANEICYTVSGRHVMPISYLPGGTGRWPTGGELERLHRLLVEARADVDALVDLFAGIEWPELCRECECLAALDEDGAYPMMGGPIHSSLGRTWPTHRYREAVEEYLVDHSAAKHARGRGGSIRVGALARYRLAHELLGWRAQRAADALGLDPETTNPFHYNPAQVVETVQAHEEAISLVEELLEDPSPEERAPVTRARGGEGFGVAEVPRGTLYHHYVIGPDGRIDQANCIIPTGQNLAAIEDDMRAFVPALLDRSEDEIAHHLEMLVRAYDPCISCSVHLLDVRFVRGGRQDASGDEAGGG